MVTVPKGPFPFVVDMRHSFVPHADFLAAGVLGTS